MGTKIPTLHTHTEGHPNTYMAEIVDSCTLATLTKPKSLTVVQFLHSTKAEIVDICTFSTP